MPLKRSALAFLLLSAALIAARASYATDLLFPAGSIVTCSVSEGKISSKTTAIGDPVLCTLNPVEKYGRSVFPYGSYLEGRFEDYKDPGFFSGRGYVELRFDKLILGNRVVPISAKVVETPKYAVDRDGRILSNGHQLPSKIADLIPMKWPLEILKLVRTGSGPVLKPETRLTLELMDDLGIADYYQQPVQHQAALIERVPQQAPQQVIYQSFQAAPAPQPQVVYQQAPPAVVYRYPSPPPPTVYYYPPQQPVYRYYGPAY